MNNFHLCSLKINQSEELLDLVTCRLTDDIVDPYEMVNNHLLNHFVDIYRMVQFSPDHIPRLGKMVQPPSYHFTRSDKMVRIPFNHFANLRNMVQRYDHFKLKGRTLS